MLQTRYGRKIGGSVGTARAGVYCEIRGKEIRKRHRENEDKESKSRLAVKPVVKTLDRRCAVYIVLPPA